MCSGHGRYLSGQPGFCPKFERGTCRIQGAWLRFKEEKYADTNLGRALARVSFVLAAGRCALPERTAVDGAEVGAEQRQETDRT